VNTSVTTPSPDAPRSERASKRWWVIAVASTLVGVVSGLGIGLVLRTNNTLHATSSQIFTSTAGIFDKENGQPAPGWSLPSLRHPSKSVALSEFVGEPVLLNFWASWCPPCRKEMPALAAAARQLRGVVAFVGIDTSDERGAAINFAAQARVGYPLVFDPQASTANNYSVDGLPTTFFISARGKLLGRQVGGMTAQRLNQLVKQIFGPTR